MNNKLLTPLERENLIADIAYYGWDYIQDDLLVRVHDLLYGDDISLKKLIFDLKDCNLENLPKDKLESIYKTVFEKTVTINDNEE